jgi:hypothetical protein
MARRWKLRCKRAQQVRKRCAVSLQHRTGCAGEKEWHCLRRLDRIGCHQDRNDRMLTRASVEILQIKGIVFHLLAGILGEILGADLELQSENGGRREQHRVDAPAQTGDLEFEQKPPAGCLWQDGNDPAQDPDLLRPGA